MNKPRDPRDHDPTWHSALNNQRQACIGGRWRQCRIQSRRKALRGLLDEEEQTGRYEKRKRIRRRTGPSRLKTYQRRRSGIVDAYREDFLETNKNANHALTRAVMSENRTLFY